MRRIGKIVSIALAAVVIVFVFIVVSGFYFGTLGR
jgi:hypothetical protein